MGRAIAFTLTLLMGSLGFAQESSATIFGRRCRPSCSRQCQPCAPAMVCKEVNYTICKSVTEQRTVSPSSEENAAQIALLRDEVDDLKAQVEELNRRVGGGAAPTVAP
jgi:ubiquinone biosynthesis protein UbiJ